MTTKAQIKHELDVEAETIFDSEAVKIEHAEVLKEILANLKPLDFRKAAAIKKDEKLAQKHIVVTCARELLKVARELKCGLSINHDYLYAYNGEFWQRLDDGEFKQFLKEASDKLGVDSITAEYHRFVEDMFRQFMASAYLPKPVARNGKTTVNLQNGTFEIEKNKFTLREFRREDFLTYQLPFAYDESAHAPRWNAFLNQVIPDVSKQMILAEYIGYIFAPQLKLEKALILYGFGQNGKSVVFDVINSLLGKENIANFSLESLAHEYYIAQLADKLLNYSSEISNRLQAHKFKQLTSGEPVEARAPYGKPFILRNYARLAFNTNDLPRDVEHTDAFFRRFLILEFDIKISNDKKNPNLAKEIAATELSGIFNWVLDGLGRLLTQIDFTKSAAVEKALADYRKESDSAALFLEDEDYSPGDDRFMLLKELYKEYKNYCLDNGYKAVSNKNLSKRMENLGYKATPNRGGKAFWVSDQERGETC